MKWAGARSKHKKRLAKLRKQQRQAKIVLHRNAFRRIRAPDAWL